MGIYFTGMIQGVFSLIPYYGPESCLRYLGTQGCARAAHISHPSKSCPGHWHCWSTTWDWATKRVRFWSSDFGGDGSSDTARDGKNCGAPPCNSSLVLLDAWKCKTMVGYSFQSQKKKILSWTEQKMCLSCQQPGWMSGGRVINVGNGGL